MAKDVYVKDVDALRLSNKGAGGRFRPGGLSKGGGLRGQGGRVSFKALFWTLFFVSALYGAYKFVPPYVSFYMLKTDVEEEAKIAHMFDDAALEKHILQKAQGWSIPLAHENIEITRGREEIRIAVNYTDTIDFLGRYTRDIPREIIIEKPLKDTSRVLH